MKSLRIVFQFGLLIGLGIAIPGLPTTAQSTSPNKAQPPAPGLQKLNGDDARRAEELVKAIEAALKADRWDEAIATSQELLGLRTRVQGPKHFETVNAEWRLKTLRRVAPMPQKDRVAYQSARTMNQQAEALWTQGKYAQAQPLFEKALEIDRRLLTDDHPDTADSYNNLAMNLNDQGKYAVAQPLFEKALEINRRLLTDNHPDTATQLQQRGDTTSTPRGSTPRHSRCTRRRWRSTAACSPTTTPTPPQLQQRGVNLNAQGKYARPSRCSRRRWRSAAACSPTTTPTPPTATTTWRPTSTPRGSTPRPSRCTRRRWRSAAACSPTTIPTPPSATTTWRTTSTPRGSTPSRATDG